MGFDLISWETWFWDVLMATRLSNWMVIWPAEKGFSCFFIPYLARPSQGLLEINETMNPGEHHQSPSITSNQHEWPSGWCFGTFFICPYIWECHHPNWLSYFSEGSKPPTRPFMIINHHYQPLLTLTRSDGQLSGWLETYPLVVVQSH